MMPATQHLHGLLLGTAIGDSVGLPAEGLSPRAIAKRGWNTEWNHRLFFGRGMWSDDTEHTIILAQALNHSGGDESRFQKLLARGLRTGCWFFPPESAWPRPVPCSNFGSDSLPPGQVSSPQATVP